MSLAPPAPESRQVVCPIHGLSPGPVEGLDGLLHLHLQPVEHVAAHQVTRPAKKCQKYQNEESSVMDS